MTETKTFNELGLSEETLQAIESKGFEEPTEIQAMTIPVMLRDDTNIIAQAQTGTGKTAAFGLPLIEMISTKETTVQAIVLAPTRELAIQVSEEINSLKGNKKIKVAPIYGGQSIDQQLRRLKNGVHIVVGTPGRVIDHLNRKTLNLRNIEHLILDEADEMLNMGFIEDMEEIMRHTNEGKRTLLFSATMPGKIKDLAKKYMEGYELLKVDKKQLSPDLTEQIYYEVKNQDKFEALCRIVDFEEEFYSLVFCRTKSDVDTLVSSLNDRGYDAAAIHGDISQAQRERTLNQFKNRKVNILVATDVAARGIDVNNLTHVINYSLPHDPEAYVHRIGRTGRAGNEGTAITFITPSEYKRLMFIQRYAKADIKKSKLPKVRDIIRSRKKKITEEVNNLLEEEVEEKYKTWALQILEERQSEDVLAAVLNYCFKDELDSEAYANIQSPDGKDRKFEGQGKTRLFVGLGKKDKMNNKKLLQLIMDKAGVNSRDISDMQVLDNFSFITVPFEKAEKIIASFKQKGKKPLITHAKKSKSKK